MIIQFKSKRFSFFIFIINIFFFYGQAKTEKDILNLEGDPINENDNETENIKIKIREKYKIKKEVNLKRIDDLRVVYFNDFYNYYFKNESNKTELINLVPNVVENYYYSEEKNINFSINWNNINQNSKLFIWIKSNKNLTNNLFQNEKYKHNDDFASYTIFETNNKSEYKFNVNSISDDHITVGVFLFDNESLSQADISNKNEKIPLLFYKKYMEKYCFNCAGTQYINYLLEDKNLNLVKIILENNSFSNIYCLKMEDYNNNNFLFFTIQYNNETNETLKILNPLILGANYQLNMKQKEKIGLFPNISKNNYNYLTYQIVGKDGIYKSSIRNCKDIENCNPSDSNQEIFNFSSITFTKKEFGNNINNTKILFIECESEWCSINVNFYTNNTENTYISSLMPFRKNLRKNNIDNFLINLTNFNNENNIYYLYIETLSGDIDDLHINDSKIEKLEFIKEKNKKSILYEIQKNETYIKIDADENIVYSMAAIYSDKNIERVIMPNMNYRFKIPEKEIKVKIDDRRDIYNKEIYYFVSFYSFDCKIAVYKLNDSNKKVTEQNNISNIYQFNISQMDNEKTFIVTNESENKENCKDDTFDITLFKYEKNFSNPFYSIILSKNRPHIFRFDDKHKEVYYKYYITDKTKDLKIKLFFQNKTKYNVSLFLNNKKYREGNYSKNEIFTTKSKDIKKKCNNETYPCLVYFNITIIDKISHDLTIEVKIYDKTNPSTFYVIGSIIGAGLLLFIIIIIIICICKNNNYMSKLRNEINTISFKDEEESQNRESKEDDDLLY